MKSFGWTLLAIGMILAAPASAQWLSPTDLNQKQSAPPDSVYREVLETLCPGEAVFEANSRGCHVCPPDTMDAGERREVNLVSAIAGHLTSPKSEDVLAVIYGCEPHANHFIDVFLLTRQASGWEMTKFEGTAAIEQGSCRKIANKEGQDGLLCYGSDMFSGVGAGALYFTYVNGGTTPILSTVAVMSPCGFQYGASTVANSDIKGIRLVPRPGGGQLLTVRASCMKGRKICRDSQDIARYPVREYMIDFQFDGTTFQVTPASAAALKQYAACSTHDFK